jgi:Fe-S cluster assembly protein SufD
MGAQRLSFQSGVTHELSLRSLPSSHTLNLTEVGDHLVLLRDLHPSHQELTIILASPGVRANIVFRDTVGGTAANSLILHIKHAAPSTEAETDIHLLVEDTAHPRITGTIHILSEAKNTQSYLSLHALLDGPEAKCWLLPGLEIQNPEVKCSHAATVRSLQPTDLFYLTSRGITPNSAKVLLTESFLHQ